MGLIAVAQAGVLIFLYAVKSIDDNATVRWDWTVTELDLFLILVALSLLLGYLFTSLRIRSHRAVVFVLAFGLSALFWGQPEILVDASRYFTYAKLSQLYGLDYFLQGWGSDFGVWTDLPLVPFLHSLIFKVFGEHRLPVEVFNSALFSLSALLTYLIGKELWGKEAGFCASLFLLASPYLYTQTPLFLVDVPSMFFFTFVIYSFIRALKEGGKWVLISSLAIASALLTKFSFWLFLLPLPLFLFLGDKRGDRIQGVKALGLGATLFIAILGVKHQVFWEQIQLLLDYQAQGLRRWGENFAGTFFFQVSPFLSLAALFSIFRGFRERDVKVALMASLVLIVFLLWLDRIRYVLPLFPAFALLAGYGVQVVGWREARFIAFSAAFFSVLLAFFFYLPFNQHTGSGNLMEAGEYLNKLQDGEVGVIPLAQSEHINPLITVPLLDIYTQRAMSVEPINYTTLPREELKTSPLRFTWEYKLPPYYEETQRPSLVVVISRENQDLPEKVEKKLEEYRVVEVFRGSNGVFDFTTSVVVYSLSSAV